MATWVSRVTRDVLVAARVSGRKGSWAVSLLETPSYPMDSARNRGVATGDGGAGQSTSRRTDLAHTLRSPLTSIKGYTSSLLRTDVAWSEELEREFLETIEREADRLNEAVSDLLDTSLDRDLPG